MSDTQTNNKRLAKNTIVLYFRMIVIMLVSLYMSRLTLKALGVEDYGIYNVVGGFVTMFTVLSGSISNAISRFITFELAKHDLKKLQIVFSTSVNVQILMALFIILLLELFGVWFLNYRMNIPLGRDAAANWVLQCSIFTFAINLISIPYNACIIAHEKMTAFAYISILDVVLKLISALSLLYFESDRLIIYSILVAISALVARFAYGWYCSENFSECRYKVIIDLKLLKQMASMASWNMLGAGASILNIHGVNLLINLFFGVAFNAARGIAVQVNSAVCHFANSFTTALNPQITKSYAQCDYEIMRNLVYKGSRYSYFLLLFISLPILMETETILKIWLATVPELTVVFVRLTLVNALVAIITTPFFTVSMATGNIKEYQCVIGSLALLVFLISYFSYSLGAQAEITYIVSIIIEFLILISRVFIVNKYVQIGVSDYFKSVIVRIILTTIVAIICPLLLHNYLNGTFLYSIVIMMVSMLSVITSVLFIGMSNNERTKIVKTIFSHTLL